MKYLRKFDIVVALLNITAAIYYLLNGNMSWGVFAALAVLHFRGFSGGKYLERWRNAVDEKWAHHFWLHVFRMRLIRGKPVSLEEFKNAEPHIWENAKRYVSDSVMPFECEDLFGENSDRAVNELFSKEEIRENKSRLQGLH